MRKESTLKSLPYFLFLTLSALLLIFIDSLGWVKGVSGFTQKTTQPVKLTLYRTRQSLSSPFSFLTFWRSGSQKIKYLEERNRELLVEAEKARSLEQENRILRAQLEISLPSNPKLLPAKTIGQGRYLTIDQGKEEGVWEGQIAIFKNFLVGKIVKVGSHESQIELPADPESKIPAQTAKTRARGLLVGKFGKEIILEKVTQGESLEIEDLVLATGEGGYLKGLILGKIDWIERKESEVFQKGGVLPALNIFELETVFLVKS